MNKIEIDKLLEKYCNAETSIAEEQALKIYFNGGKVDPDFSKDAQYFQALSLEANTPVADFDPLAKLKALQSESQAKETKVISIFKYWKAAAAAVILGVASVWIVKATLSNTMSTSSEVVARKGKARIINLDDLAEAEEYSEDAVKLLASVLKTPTKEVKKGMENLDKVSVVTMEN
jgi:hypothetical protein